MALVLIQRLRLRQQAADRARDALAAELHGRALAFDRRCDALQAAADDLATRQRIDHLAGLVRLGEHRGKLPHDVAQGLERYALGLHDEAAAEERAG